MSLSLTLLAGCATTPSTVFVREVPVTAVSTNNLDAIRFASTYHAYTVGRRIDPKNPKLMHDTHVIYLRELPDRWNLNPAKPSVSQSPPAVDPAFDPLPLEQQLRLELKEQQNVSQTLKQQSERFQQAADLVVPATQKAAEVLSWLQERQQLIEERLRRLENQEGPKAPPPISLQPTNQKPAQQQNP